MKLCAACGNIMTDPPGSHGCDVAGSCVRSGPVNGVPAGSVFAGIVGKASQLGAGVDCPVCDHPVKASVVPVAKFPGWRFKTSEAVVVGCPCGSSLAMCPLPSLSQYGTAVEQALAELLPADPS